MDRALLGADFLALHTVAVADTVIVSQADAGDVNFQRPDVARKLSVIAAIVILVLFGMLIGGAA